MTIGGKEWSPHNYDEDYRGTVTAREALEGSLNVPTVHAAIEIGDSRIAPPPTLAGIVADNGAAACFVLADPGATVLELLPEVAVELAVNGVATASGLRTAPLGEPLETAVWLAQAGVRRGLPLRAGDVLLTGSIGPVAPLRRGDHVRVTIDGVGTCSFTFGEKA